MRPNVQTNPHEKSKSEQRPRYIPKGIRKCDPNFYNQFIDFPHSLKQKNKKETFINMRKKRQRFEKNYFREKKCVKRFYKFNANYSILIWFGFFYRITIYLVI